jgi:HlyD family secretion protein
LKALRGKTLRWAGVAAIALSVGLIVWVKRPPAAGHYVTAPVTLGSIVKSVTTTGTVNPVVTVQVGTYVSGPITALYVDFNSPVKAGQMMAKIDPRPFAATVALAKAGLANARAQLQKDIANRTYQELTFKRDIELYKSSVVSQDQRDS